MSENLKRKMCGSRSSRAASSGSVEGVLRKTLPRDADSVLSLDIALTEIRTRVVDRAAVLAALEDNQLTYLIQNLDGARGLLSLDESLLASVVECAVSGKISKKQRSPRASTSTDAAIAAEMVDAWLASAAAEMEEEGLTKHWPAQQFERGRGPVSERQAALLLDAEEFHSVLCSIAIEGGARVGWMRIATPLLKESTSKHASNVNTGIEEHLLDAPVALRAVLARLPLGMHQVTSLEEGSVIPLPAGSLQNVRLETREGRLVDKARLGVTGGRKAVRLDMGALQNEPPALPGSGSEVLSDLSEEALTAPASLPDDLAPASLEPHMNVVEPEEETPVIETEVSPVKI